MRFLAVCSRPLRAALIQSRVKSSGWGGEGTLKFRAGLVASSVSAKPGWLPSRGGLEVTVALIRAAMASFRCCRRLGALRSECRAVSGFGCPWWFWKRGSDVGPPQPAPTGLTHSVSWLWGRALGAPPIEAECAPGCGTGGPPRRAGTPGHVRAPPQMSLHATVQLPVAMCLHCSPDVPALGTKCVRPAERLGEPGHHPLVMSKSAESPQPGTGEGAGPVLSSS